MKLITVEEHFMSKTIYDAMQPYISKSTELEKARFQFVDHFVHTSDITEVGERRIAFMDANGISAQIIGYGNYSPMTLRKEDGAVEFCRLANDELYQSISRYPGRFYGYATLPMDDVDAAVSELERCVKELDFRGLMLNGPLNGQFFDDSRFFPVFKKASDLSVPVYIHPAEVSHVVSDHYYMGDWSLMTANLFSGFAIGWHYDTAMHLMRFILSGIFDKLPGLKIIVGHWGELLPYYFDRMNAALNPKVTGLNRCIKDYFYDHVYTNPSGMYYKDDFDFCRKVFHPEHLMWAQDYPYGVNDAQVSTFLEEYGLSDQEKQRIAHENAEKLFRL